MNGAYWRRKPCSEGSPWLSDGEGGLSPGLRPGWAGFVEGEEDERKAVVQEDSWDLGWM